MMKTRTYHFATEVSSLDSALTYWDAEYNPFGDSWMELKARHGGRMLTLQEAMCLKKEACGIDAAVFERPSGCLLVILLEA